jgi:hypothetical protein
MNGMNLGECSLDMKNVGWGVERVGKFGGLVNNQM